MNSTSVTCKNRICRLQSTKNIRKKIVKHIKFHAKPAFFSPRSSLTKSCLEWIFSIFSHAKIIFFDSALSRNNTNDSLLKISDYFSRKFAIFQADREICFADIWRRDRVTATLWARLATRWMENLAVSRSADSNEEKEEHRHTHEFDRIHSCTCLIKHDETILVLSQMAGYSCGYDRGVFRHDPSEALEARLRVGKDENKK